MLMGDILEHTAIKSSMENYVGTYKYVVVDAALNDILASFDYRSDLTKWLLSRQNKVGNAASLTWICRIRTRELDVITSVMMNEKQSFYKVVAIADKR